MREISAGIIIYRKTEEGPKFLILYHGKGYWNFPKGKIEQEETSFQTALREISEETGLGRMDLKFDHSFKTSEKFTFWRDRERVFKIVTFYLAETKRKAIKISEVKEGQPHEGFAWFTLREALKVLAKNKGSQMILTQANNFLNKQKNGLTQPRYSNGLSNSLINHNNSNKGNGFRKPNKIGQDSRIKK